jgi:hypothetical protein
MSLDFVLRIRWCKRKHSQEDHEAILGYIARPCLQEKKKKKGREEGGWRKEPPVGTIYRYRYYITVWTAKKKKKK